MNLLITNKNKVLLRNEDTSLDNQNVFYMTRLNLLSVLTGKQVMKAFVSLQSNFEEHVKAKLM